MSRTALAAGRSTPLNDANPSPRSDHQPVRPDVTSSLLFGLFSRSSLSLPPWAEGIQPGIPIGALPPANLPSVGRSSCETLCRHRTFSLAFIFPLSFLSFVGRSLYPYMVMPFLFRPPLFLVFPHSFSLFSFLLVAFAASRCPASRFVFLVGSLYIRFR